MEKLTIVSAVLFFSFNISHEKWGRCSLNQSLKTKTNVDTIKIIRFND